MKAMIVILFLVLLCAAGQLEAQSNPPCVSPAWVTTSPIEAWMPIVCSTFTFKSYDEHMQPKEYLLTVLGYWNGSLSNQPLVYAQSTYDPTQVWLIDHATFDANRVP